MKHSALTNPVSCISNSGFNDLKESPHCHNLITPFRDPIFDNYDKRLTFFHRDKRITYLKKKEQYLIPDATRSVLSKVAILEIHIG